MSTNQKLLSFLKEPHSLIECRAHTQTSLCTNHTNIGILRQLAKVYIDSWFILPNGSVKPRYKVGIRPDATRPRFPRKDNKDTIQASILEVLPATAKEIQFYLKYKADAIALHLTDMIKSSLIHITNASKVMSSKAEPLYVKGRGFVDVIDSVEMKEAPKSVSSDLYGRNTVIHQRDGYQIQTTWRHQ